MIRTRNFLLLVTAFVGGATFALAYSVSTTLSASRAYADQATVILPLSPPREPIVAAPATATTSNDAVVMRLREKIAAGQGEHTDEPIVASSATHDAPVAQQAVRNCASTRNVTGIMATWRPERTVVRTVEGARLVATMTATGEMRTRVQLPLTPQQRSTPHCLPHEIIGVSVNGELLTNEDARRFRGAAPATRIGYALDGFPIYGPAPDTITRDECGGVTVGEDYRYTVDTDKGRFLSCFQGTPARLLK